MVFWGFIRGHSLVAGAAVVAVPGLAQRPGESGRRLPGRASEVYPAERSEVYPEERSEDVDVDVAVACRPWHRSPEFGAPTPKGRCDSPPK